MQNRVPKTTRSPIAFRPLAVAFLLLAAMVAGVSPAAGGLQSSATVTPDSTTWGAQTKYVVLMPTSVAAGTKVNVNITFSDGFALGEPSDYEHLKAHNTSASGVNDDRVAGLRSGYVYIHETTAEANPTPLEITVKNVLNPLSQGNYWVNVSVYNSATTLLADWYNATIAISEGANAFSNATWALDSPTAGADTEGDFKFTPPQSGNKVELRFPSGFNASQSGGTGFTWSETDLTLTKTGISFTQNVAFTLTDLQVTLPAYNDTFAVGITTWSGTTLLDVGALTLPVQPGAMVVNHLGSGQKNAGATGSIGFTFTLANDLPAASQVNITFPNSNFSVKAGTFQLYNASGVIIDNGIIDDGDNFTAGGPTVHIEVPSGVKLNAGENYNVTFSGVSVPNQIGETEPFVFVTNTTSNAHKTVDRNNGTKYLVSAIGSLTINSVTATASTAGARGNVSINATAGTSGLDGVQLVFPATYKLNAGGTSNINVTGDASVATNLTDTTNGRINITGLSALTTFIVNVSNVQLPHQVGAATPVSIRAMDGFVEKVNGSAPLTLSTGKATITQIDAGTGNAKKAGDGNGNYTIHYTPQNPAKAGDEVIVTFPAGFDLANVDVTGPQTDIQLSGNMIHGDNASVNAGARQVIILVNDTVAYDAYTNQKVDVTANVTNPGSSGKTGNFTVTLEKGGTTILETNVSASQVNPTLDANSFDNVTVTGSPGVSNKTSTFTVAVKLNNSVPAGGAFNVTFPGSFNVSAANGYTINGVSAAGTSHQKGGQVVNFTVPGSLSLGRGQTATLAVQGIQHGHAQTYSGMIVESRSAAHALIDKNTSIDVVIKEGALAVSITAVNQTEVGKVGTYRFTVQPSATVPGGNGQINLTFPAGFDLSQVGVGDVTASPTNASNVIAVDSGLRTVSVNFAENIVGGGAPAVITINDVVNPKVAGTSGKFVVKSNFTGGPLDKSDQQTVTISAPAGAGLSTFSVSYQTLERAKNGTVSITLANATAFPLAAGSGVNFTFPGSFDLDAAEIAGANLYVNHVLLSKNNWSTGDNYLNLTINQTIATALAGSPTLTVNVTDLRMPRLNTTTGQFTALTFSPSGVQMQNGTTSPAGSVAAVNFQNVNIITTNNGLGALATYSVFADPHPNTTKSGGYRANETFAVTLPSGFTFPSGASYAFNFGSAARDGTTQTVIGTFNQDYTNPGTLRLDLVNIRNPTSATGCCTGAFNLTTANGSHAMEVNKTQTVALTAAPSMVVSSSALTVAEGGTQTFTVGLGTLPASGTTVKLNLVSSVGSAATVSPASLTFTTSAAAQTVTVSGVNDDSITGNRSSTITVSVDQAATTDSAYDPLSPETVAVTVTDNDAASLVIGGTPVVVSEQGPTSAGFTVRLGSQPSAPVTIAVTSTSTDITFSPASLTFTSSNWNSPQTVSVTAVDDSDVEGTESATITLTPSSSGDSNYNALAASSVGVSITDNDRAGVTLTQSGGSTRVTEGGATDTYTVVLDKQPAGNVVITANASSQITVSPASITFTSSNWNTSQSFTVTAVNDDVAEGEHSGTITHTASSTADSDYNGATVAPVTVTITDNDHAVMVTETGGSTSVTEGSSSADTYRVRLSVQPTANVNVSVVPSGNLNVTPAFVLFNATNWATEQTVTVRADNNNDVDGDRVHGINHTVSSTDSNYNGLSVATLNVTVLDDDSDEAEPTGPTAAEIEAANKKVKVTVTRDGDKNIVEWELPTGDDLPGDVEGVQVWFSNSPYALAATYEKDEAGFTDAKYEHTGDLAKATTKYLVTMFYGGDAGKFDAATAPDTDDFAGTASSEESKITDEWWFWLLVAIGGLLVILIIVLIVVAATRRRSEDEDDWDDDLAWDDDEEDEEDEPEPAPAPAPEAAPVGETHHMNCPRCKNSFDAVGTKPFVTTCPNCNARGMLR